MADTTLLDLVESVRRSAPAVEIGLPAAADDPRIEAISHDSRSVGHGTLFACLTGDAFDGHDFASDAVAAGASALLVERPLDLGVPEVVAADTREALGWMSAALHDFPSRRLAVVGVTGTNGKTTTAHLLAEILRNAGRSATTIGTLTGTYTTPEAPDLQRAIAAEVEAGTDVIVMEVSSHALAQHRVAGTWFEVAAFTNLSLDHLDYHLSFEDYFEAKASLFRPDRSAISIVDVGSPMGRRLSDLVATEVIEVSIDDVADIELHPEGSTFRYADHNFRVGLAGRFNISNSLVALRCAVQLGLSLDEIASGLAAASAVPGRVERIDEGQPFSVLVDYAHTPDGLSNVLATARELTDGRVVVVFGCAGDRDRNKRPEMASVAADLADHLVVTSDNPRSEDPLAIIEEVVAGIPADAERPKVEPDRRAAIAMGLDAAHPGDIVVIAGKGHETTQTIGDRVIDFDDRVVVRELLVASAEGAS